MRGEGSKRAEGPGGRRLAASLPSGGGKGRREGGPLLRPAEEGLGLYLNPRERDRLLLYAAADLAERRRARGLALGYPEAVAVIAVAILEGARDGRSVPDLMEAGRAVLGVADVLPGVAELLPLVQVEATFPDGTKLVSVHDPLCAGPAESPPRYLWGEGEIELAPGRPRRTLTVESAGDRPIQVGSHYHFYEVNRALRFDREAAKGMRLDIPAGTAVRFEPGETRTVDLVAFGGARQTTGAALRGTGSG